MYSPGGTWGPRVQQDYQLVILHSGHLDLILDDCPIVIAAGQAILLHPRHHEYFQFSAKIDSRHSWCSLRPIHMPRTLVSQLKEVCGPILWTPRLQQLFMIGFSYNQSLLTHQDLEIKRSIYLALHLFTEFALETLSQSGSVTDQRLEKMKHLIACESHLPLKLADLARASGLSKQHILKICRHRGLPSPIRQLYLQRLETAADLLLHTGLSIKEISERCGFINPYHFSRKFSEWSQLSPRFYRNKMQKDNRFK